MLDTEIHRPGYALRLWIDFQGRHRIYLNGQQVADKTVWGSRAEHNFQQAVDGRLVNFKVVLEVLGLTKCRCRIFEEGAEVHVSEHRLSFNPKLRDVFSNWLPKAPRWAWIFIGLCLLIPISTMGGAVPAVIGFAGAWGCAGVASNKNWPIAVRVMVCVVVTIASWVGLSLVLAALHPALGKP